MKTNKRELLRQHKKLLKIYETRAKKHNDTFSRDLAKSQRLAIKRLKRK